MISNAWKVGNILTIIAMIVTTGCGPRRPEWMVPPTLDPAAVTQAAMKVADVNRDGLLHGEELAAIPALQASLEQLDTNGDRRLSATELEAWLTKVRDENSAFYEAPLKVSHLGKPIANALVKLVPEACMGPTAEPAEGQTDETGLAFASAVGGKTFGVRGGLYRVQIRGRLPNGAPISDRYQAATTFGIAVGAGLPQPRTPTFELD